MLKIKLARFGKKNQPHYRIVVNEARDKRDGSYVAKVGHYAPTQTPKILEIDVKAYNEWVGKGAQPTPTVARLFEKFNSPEPFPAKKAKPSKKAQEKAKAASAAKEAPEAQSKEVTQETKAEPSTDQAEAAVTETDQKDSTTDSQPEDKNQPSKE